MSQTHDIDHSGHSAHAPRPAASGAPVRDPVCGMNVDDPSAAKHHAEHAGVTYYFCSAKCRQKFAAEPQRYLEAADTAPAPPAKAGTIYTCPMHAQIRQPA